jgi:hypothetical protein
MAQLALVRGGAGRLAKASLTLPELADAERRGVAAALATHVLDELADEIALRISLCRLPQLTEMCLTASKRKPYAPVSLRTHSPQLLLSATSGVEKLHSLQVLLHLGVVVVDCTSALPTPALTVGKHEVVVRAVLVVDVSSPALAVSLDLVDRLGLGLVVIVDAREVVKVPLELGVRVAAPGEGELGPALDVVHVADRLVAVVLVDHGRHELLGLVRARLVVQHGVDVRDDAGFAGLLDCGEKVLLVAPLGALCALLVELAEVPQVIASVSERPTCMSRSTHMS